MKMKILTSVIALLLVGGSLTAFAAQPNANQAAAIKQTETVELSAVVFRQDGDTVKASYDNGNSWEATPEVNTPDYFTYDEYAAWIETERKSLDSLVDAGEMTREEVNDTISKYSEILSEIENGLQVAKRDDFSEEQQFFSMPNAMHTEGFQTVICDENGYQSFGPYEAKAELHGALKEYTDKQVAMGGMTQENENEILTKYE